MPTKFYYVNIDTVESTQVRNMPRGIVNSYIVKAIDENQARQIVLRTMAPAVASQLQNSLYVYDLDSIMYAIDNAEASGRSLPMFSFMPLNGSRPRRQLNLPTRPVDQVVEGVSIYQEAVAPIQNAQPSQQPTVLTESVVTQPKSQPQPVQKAPVVMQPQAAINPRQIRSSMFQRNDAPNSPTTPNTLTPEQQRLIAGVGAFPAGDGADEGVNARINAAVGRNLNQTRQVTVPGPKDSLTQEQYNILQKINALNPVPVTIESDSGDDQALAMERAKAAELASLPGDTPIGEADLMRLQAEFAEAEAAAGIKVEGSKPLNPESVKVSMELKSSINEVLSSKTIK